MDKTISQDIIYIGCDDKDITQFEGQYVLEDGMCYNSYVILDEKIAILDTVDKAKKQEWLKNLDKALNGKKPDYIVVQHVEPDHSSVLGEFVSKYPETKIVTSAAAQKMLPLYFPDLKAEFVTVKEGDKLCLGNNTLQFFAAPMVHWPEVIVTYAIEKKVLFSADGFGKFGVYDSEPDDWSCEARRYYFNICGKYGAQVQNLLKKAATLDIQIICPLHGPILRGEMLSNAIRLYDIWSKYEVETQGVFIAYCTMHSNTGKAAEYLKDILVKGGKKVAIANLCEEDWAEALEDAFRHDTLVLASPTYDGGLFPKMVDFIHHLKIKNFQKRKVAFIENGSWAPQAARIMKESFTDFKDIEIVETQATIKGAFKEADKQTIETLAKEIL
ncbi:MAG: FprA family A-type flavoprotein [Bacteroidales bacterium]|nr:FprA family A-type flavoprotein [Bacteroidales bacterium]